MKTYRIATIPGDGIGKEVVPAGQRVLEALAAADGSFGFEFENFDWGGDWFRAHGEMMPANGLDALRGKDAILFGSAGDPHIPDHITLWGLRLKICQGFDQYANVRPTRILPGIDGPLKRCQPEDLNWVIVRENSEGEYSGVGGRVHQGHPIEAATDVSMMTRVGVDQFLVPLHVGKLGGDLAGDLVPHHHRVALRIALGHHGQLLARPRLRQLEGEAQHALDAGTGHDRHVGRGLDRVALVHLSLIHI